ncbi:glycosyltransferase family 2 protein [Virgibacillus halophilus]|uniref:Glycosyltransferase family 2 protein n=1 Tax=Tigheibacillus halophilus TaxID=361280 RepID=A0ABU5C400_9BACI|nr:glycosyltransferase family 2 protein [Virgibacillus halophilus]
MGKNNATVSLIVPIFHTASLVNCIDSIVNQSYRDLEIILINGCLSEESVMICQTFAEKDTRIVLLEAETPHIVSALNYGLAYASGEFVQFVSAEDYIDGEMTEKLVAKMDCDTQLVLCGYREIEYRNRRFFTEETIPQTAGRYLKHEFMERIDLLPHQFLLFSPNNKLYRNEVIQNNQIKFPGSLYLEATAFFNLAYWEKTVGMHAIAEPLYHFTSSAYESGQIPLHSQFESRQKLYQQVENLLKANNTFHGKNKVLLQRMRANFTLSMLDSLFDPANTLASIQKKRNHFGMVNE